MEQKDKIRKDELFEKFECEWEKTVDSISRSDRESLPFSYMAELDKSLKPMLSEYCENLRKTFAAIPSMDSVGAEQREKMFMDVVKKNFADIYSFLKNMKDIDQRKLGRLPLPPQYADKWKRFFMRALLMNTSKYDMDPARFLLSNAHYYTVALQAGLLDQAGAIDKYKETGRADVLLWDMEKNLARLKEDEGLKWLSEDHDVTNPKALYLYAAMAHDHRTGKMLEAMYPEFYLISKIEEASRHDCEYIDKTYDHDDSMFCDRVATMMDYFHECFTPVFPNLRNMTESSEPYGMTPILGSVLKVAKERDEKLLHDSDFVKTHPDLAWTIKARLVLSRSPSSDVKSEAIELRKYGEQIMKTAYDALYEYSKHAEMSDEEKTKFEDQQKGFEKLISRFEQRIFDPSPEACGYASWPKGYQFIRSSSDQKTPAATEPLKSTSQKTSDTAEPSKPTEEKTPDAVEPARPTNHPHRKKPKLREL